MGSRLILSSGFTIRRAYYARASSAPLGKAAASRPEGGERHHDGRIFHRRTPMSRRQRQARLRKCRSEPDCRDPVRTSRRPLHAGEAQDRGRDPEGGLRDPEGEPRRGGRQEDHRRIGAPLGHRAGPPVRRGGAGRAFAQGLPGRDAALDQGRGARDRGQGADRHRPSPSTSCAAAMPRPTRRWGWARSAICCRATATAPSARATTPSSSSSAARPSCRAPATATSEYRYED